MERGGTTYYYHRDVQNSITEMSDESGTLVEQYDYDVYGEPRIFNGLGELLDASAIQNRYLYTGRRYDPESGNSYFRARMYSPALGRFLQMDPLEYEDGMNPYMNRFVINGIDPYGKKTVKIQSNEGGLVLKINDNTGLIERIEVEIPKFFNIVEILSYTVKSNLHLTLRCQGPEGIQKKSTLIDLPTLHWAGGKDNRYNANCKLMRHIEVLSSSPLVAVVPVPLLAAFPPLLFLEDCPECKILSSLAIDLTMVIEMPGLGTCGLLYKALGGKTGTIYM